MVRDFAQREIAPNVMKWDEPGTFPLETVKELGKLGLLGTIFPTEYSGAGMGYVEYVIAIEELSRVDGSVGIIVAAHTSLCSNHIFIAGNEEQKQQVHSEAGDGRVHRRVGADRARLGIGRGRRALHRRAQGQQVGAERHQDLHHQRALRRRRGGHRGDGQDGAHARALGVCRGEGNQGLPHREERKQARPARQRHLGTDLRGLRDCRPRACWAPKGRASSTP